jgi:hypothetical protein
MWHDLKTLIGLEYRQIKQQSRDALLILGIDQEASYGYLFYVVLFMLFWVFTMWTYVVEQVYELSRQAEIAPMTDLLGAMPSLIFVIQVIYLIVMLRGKPLKLTLPNMAYVGASPVSRQAVALLYAVKSALLPLAVISTLSILITMFFLWTFDLPNVGVIGLLSFPLSFALGLLTILLGWGVGLAKQVDRSRRWLYWLIVPLVVLGGLVVPDGAFWIGQVWVKGVDNTLHVADLILLAVGLMGAGWLLTRVARQIDMTEIMEDSQIYARIQKLGVFGQMVAPDVVSSIKSQAKLAKRQVTTSKFPRPLTGKGALVGYNMVNIYRLSPSLILQLLFSGITYPSIIILLITMVNFDALQAWALVLIVLTQLRPKNLTRFFQDHHNRPHLRQFLPVDNLSLFITQTALPLSVMSVGLGVAIALQGLQIEAFFLGVVILIGLALCQIQFDLQSEGFKIAYEYQVIFFGAIVIGAGYLSGSLLGALGLVVALDVMMAWGIRGTKQVIV